MTPAPDRMAGAMTVAGPRYWAALCLASLLGADLGDLLAHVLHWGHWRGVAPLLVLLAGALLMHRRACIATGAWFWIAVVLVRAIATNLADLATHDLHLGQAPLLAVLGFGLLACCIGTTPRRTGTRFWSALFLAGTLGTVLGDDASHRIGLAPASLLLGLALAVAFGGAARSDRTPPSRYWPLVLLARTAGTSIADLLADRSGLGLAGSTMVIALLFAAIVAGAGRERPQYGAA